MYIVGVNLIQCKYIINLENYTARDMLYLEKSFHLTD
jgi:hypothetical protein